MTKIPHDFYRCPVCRQGTMKEVDLNEGMAYKELLIPRIKYVCSNCEFTCKNYTVTTKEGQIVNVEWEDN